MYFSVRGGGYNSLLTALWAESNSPLHRERIECSTQSVVSILGEGLARREEVRQDAFYRVHSHPQSVALGIQLVLPAKIKQRLDSQLYRAENDKKALFTTHHSLIQHLPLSLRGTY